MVRLSNRQHAAPGPPVQMPAEVLVGSRPTLGILLWNEMMLSEMIILSFSI